MPEPDGTLVQQPLPADNREQWGVAIGGPVPGLRHRLYWHYTYDQQQRDFPALSTITNSPQLALAQAIPSDSSGNNPSGYSCAALTTGPLKSTGSETAAATYGAQGACFLNLYDSTIYPTYAFAAAAYDNALAYVYSLLGQAPRHANTISNLPRLDWDLSSRSNLTLAWNNIDFTSPAGGQTQPYVAGAVTSLGNDRLTMNDVSARLNTLLSPMLDNEFRIGYAHDSESEYAQSPLPQEPHTAPNGINAPGVRISETLTLGTPPTLNRTAYPRESRLQFADTLAWVHNNHTFRIGADFLHTTDGIAALYAGNGDYHYDNIQDFLIDEATQQAIPSERCGINNGSQYLCYSSYEQGLGTPGISFHINQYAVFAQDNWKARRRLTLNLGLRYDYEQLPAPQLPNPLLPASATFPADKNNFAPRIGFAWDIFGTGTTLLRGGYGIFYGLTPGTSVFNALTNTGIISEQSQGQSRYLFTSGADSPSYPETLSAPPRDQRRRADGHRLRAALPAAIHPAGQPHRRTLHPRQHRHSSHGTAVPRSRPPHRHRHKSLRPRIQQSSILGDIFILRRPLRRQVRNLPLLRRPKTQPKLRPHPHTRKPRQRHLFRSDLQHPPSRNRTARPPRPLHLVPRHRRRRANLRQRHPQRIAESLRPRTRTQQLHPQPSATTGHRGRLAPHASF